MLIPPFPASPMRFDPFPDFPDHKLSVSLCNPQKEPLILVACGSFSPITYLHLRMFEMAADYIREHNKFDLIGGYFSPVNSKYDKPGLEEAEHRIEMCKLAVECSDWLMVDPWEALQNDYQPSAAVLDHFHYEINVVREGMGGTRPVRIMLLAGGDLIESFGTLNLWADKDLHHILGDYGCFIIERTGSDVWAFLLSHDILYQHRKNVFVVKQLIYNDISSTKVRLFIKRNMSIKFLVPDEVLHYIIRHQLFKNGEHTPMANFF